MSVTEREVDTLNTFLTSNKAKFRVARTLFQALIGFLMDYIVQIMAMTPLSGEIQAIIVALTMAILSPIMAMFGTHDEKARDYDRGDLDA